MIYLDYASSTKPSKEVLDTYIKYSEYYYNPNSSHKLGKKAKQMIDESTKNIANNLNVLPEEIIYTSGASESNNLAIKGICERYKNYGKHILISPLEHTSITNACLDTNFEVEVLPLKMVKLILIV